jgi:hypothetical protein
LNRTSIDYPNIGANGGARDRAWQAAHRRCIVNVKAVNENFSLIVMCLFLLGSLAFLAQQLTSYH